MKFNVIALVVVVLTILLVAALFIPAFFGGMTHYHFRNASASLKQLASVEVMWKSADSDEDGNNDYWTKDVAGLYYFTPSGWTASVRMIELSIALADADTSPQDWNHRPPHRSVPKSSYWFQSLRPTGKDRFEFVTYPNVQGNKHDWLFIVNETGVMHKFHPDSQGEYLLKPPEIDSTDTNAVLKPGIRDLRWKKMD